jgi:hypothetical protein
MRKSRPSPAALAALRDDALLEAVQRQFMSVPEVQAGLRKLGFTRPHFIG